MSISQKIMKVSALIRHFKNSSSLSFENNRQINVNTPSSKKFLSLVQKFEVKTSCCVEVSDDLDCSSIVLPLDNSCSMFKRNAGSSSSIASLPTASTYNSDDMSSVISDESVSSSDIEFPILSCIDVERIDYREMDSKIDDLIIREKEYDDFRLFLTCLQINY